MRVSLILQSRYWTHTFPIRKQTFPRENLGSLTRCRCRSALGSRIFLWDEKHQLLRDEQRLLLQIEETTTQPENTVFQLIINSVLCIFFLFKLFFFPVSVVILNCNIGMKKNTTNLWFYVEEWKKKIKFLHIENLKLITYCTSILYFFNGNWLGLDL